ncbi:helix-turn-helix domain-containing protein [Actinomadura rugatobispora]|uniref:Helix-turn-helix domain-containing protein n=1 Tax=Actinomadura rugatobispora TaxID=1994 RepID=A0ABW1A857_9ACTN
MSDNPLGEYLRGRREAVTPADVGLPAGTRRRTPGLRRAELATLAGISVEYLTRLEQGRDRNPSVQVLAALADALRLPPDERFLLRRLAKAAEGASAFPCPASTPPVHTVRPTVRALLDRLEPAPAVLLNRLSDVLAHTTGFDHLARPAGILDGERPNLLRYLFTDARARTVYPDWERVADEHIARLKSESCPDDPHLVHLNDDLTVIAGAPFTRRIASVSPLPSHTGDERFAHPEAGELRLSYETLSVADGQRLLVYLPADDATAAALDRLSGLRPGALHAVDAVRAVHAS